MDQTTVIEIVETNSDITQSPAVDALFRELADAELLYVGGGAGEVIPG